MVQCFVPDCNQRSENASYKFYRFPKDEREKKRWVDLIRRQDRGPRDADRVCSYHFVDGEKSAGPTIFRRNEKKRFDFSSPEKKSKRKRLVFAEKQQNVMTTPQTPLPNVDEFLDATPVNSNPVFSKATMSIMMENLEEKIKSLTEELKYLKLTFSYEHIKGNDELIM